MNAGNRIKAALSIVVIALAFATPAYAAITLDGSASWDKDDWTGTYDASGSDKLVVVVSGEHNFPDNLTGDVTGIQLGVINMTEGDFKGWQAGPLSKVGGFMTGIQSGLIASMNEGGKGLQASGITVSKDFTGVQLGVVNYAVQFHGIQLGLINIIKQGGMLPFFPFFNFSFD